MKKPTIIIIGIIIVIIVALGAVLLFGQKGSSTISGTTTGTLPPVSTTTTTMAIPTSTTITLGTSQGNVTTSNFYQSAQFITQDQQTVAVKDNSEYIIAYNVGDSSFSNALTSMPLETARQDAESALLSSLGISKQDACKLTVYEGVPADVSDQYVGQSFPLSFCGGAPATL